MTIRLTLLTITAFVASFGVFAQCPIQNAGFEDTWNSGTPPQWDSPTSSVSKTDDVQAGAQAALVTPNIPIDFSNPGTSDKIGLIYQTIPCTDKPVSLTLSFKAENFSAGDEALLFIGTYDEANITFTSISDTSKFDGKGTKLVTSNSTGYVQTTIDLAYTNSDEPANVMLGVVMQRSSSSTGTIKSDAYSITYPTVSSAAKETQIDMSVSPNPFSESLIIRTTASGKTSVEIYDLTGNTVVSARTIKNGQAVDTSNLPSGIYIAKLSSGSQVVTKRIAKK